MTRVALIGLLVAGVALGSPVAGAKKKVKRVGPAEATLSANQAIPDAVPFGGPGVLRSPITVGQRFKGRTIADVNVTVQTTGATAMAAEGLAIRLTSPRGNSAELVEGDGPPSQSFGPLTFDDETPLRLCFDPTPPCQDPDTTSVFTGTAHPTGFLSELDGGPVSGVWTLTVQDRFEEGTSILSSWGLVVTPVRPVRPAK